MSVPTDRERVTGDEVIAATERPALAASLADLGVAVADAVDAGGANGGELTFTAELVSGVGIVRDQVWAAAIDQATPEDFVAPGDIG